MAVIVVVGAQESIALIVVEGRVVLSLLGCGVAVASHPLIGEFAEGFPS